MKVFNLITKKVYNIVRRTRRYTLIFLIHNRTWIFHIFQSETCRFFFFWFLITQYIVWPFLKNYVHYVHYCDPTTIVERDARSDDDIYFFCEPYSRSVRRFASGTPALYAWISISIRESTSSAPTSCDDSRMPRRISLRLCDLSALFP